MRAKTSKSVQSKTAENHYWFRPLHLPAHSFETLAQFMPNSSPQAGQHSPPAAHLEPGPKPTGQALSSRAKVAPAKPFLLLSRMMARTIAAGHPFLLKRDAVFCSMTLHPFCLFSFLPMWARVEALFPSADWWTHLQHFFFCFLFLAHVRHLLGLAFLFGFPS